MVAHWLGLDREHGNSTTPPTGRRPGMRQIDLLPEHPASRTAAVLHRQHRFQQAPGYGVGFAPLCLVNIDEFDSVKDTHQSYLKHILQKANVSTRLPYQTANRNLRRYATFIATSNNFNILTDPTGSRRFICIEVTDTIDIYNRSTTSSCMHRRWKHWLTANATGSHTRKKPK